MKEERHQLNLANKDCISCKKQKITKLHQDITDPRVNYANKVLTDFTVYIDDSVHTGTSIIQRDPSHSQGCHCC